jgi:flavin reductase (DIM6/NTAB) family NADH-FMN oxidoreductase RutF
VGEPPTLPTAFEIIIDDGPWPPKECDMATRLRFKLARGNLCMPIVLVSAQHEGVKNVMTAAWSSPSSFDPPLIQVAIGTTRFTHDLIMKSKEFVLNIVSEEQMELAEFCGNTSGREIDKFMDARIPFRPGRKVGAPVILGCVANIECTVAGYFLAGDHTVFVGETVAYQEDKKKRPLIRFRGGFFELGKELGKDTHKAKV